MALELVWGNLMRNRNLFAGAALLSAAMIMPSLTLHRGQAQAVSAPEALGEKLEIISRGQDFAVYRSLKRVAAPDGIASYRTNQFTLLKNGLNYFEGGVWKGSQDVIESFPDCAVVCQGPHRAIFSPDLNAQAVFDIVTADGCSGSACHVWGTWLNAISP